MCGKSILYFIILYIYVILILFLNYLPHYLGFGSLIYFDVFFFGSYLVKDLLVIDRDGY